LILVLVPLNFITRQALEELLPTAKAHDVGVVVMKPLSAKTSTLITCLYNPSLSLISDEPELKALLGNNSDDMVANALRYVLSQDIATAIPGLKSIHEVETAAKAGEQYTGLTTQEMNHFNFNFGANFCRDCGQCLPCPKNINIAAILRFQTLYEVYMLKVWAKKLYSGLEVKVDKCTECGKCEQKCPYRLAINSMLKKTDSELNQK
jgi:predicted aldo/keto reductase-like oxidoreductase